MSASLSTLILIPAAAVAAPLVATALGRWVKIPIVVFEIVIGLLIGPSILGWVKADDFISQLANLGLAMLFFLAGNEIDFTAIKGRPLRRSSLGWLISLIVGIGVGILVTPTVAAGVFVGIALSSTALGTIMPVLRDAGELHTPFGKAATAVGAAGEFGPLIAISVFLSGRGTLASALILVGFVIVAGLGIWLASRGPYPRLHRMITATLHTSGQWAVRLVILILAALAGLGIALGLDMLLGAFAAGVLFRVLLSGAQKPDRLAIESKLEAVGFGFLVPVFFINTGVTFDLKSLVSDPHVLLLLPIFLVLFLIIRGLPSTLAVPPGSTIHDRVSMLLLGSTALPIIVAVTGIGLESHELSTGTAAALVGAGMLSVLLFPLLALVARKRSPDGGVRPPDEDSDIEVPAEG